MLAQPWMAVLALGALLAAQSEEPGRATPDPRFRSREIEGFTVWLRREALEARGDELAAMLEHLEQQLHQVVRTVPLDRIAALRRVPIWVEVGSETACAAYHPSRQWLLDHDYDPPDGVPSTIEIGNADTFLTWTLHQPWMVLHELAHGHNHLNLAAGRGYRYAPLEERYREVVEAGLYERVLGHQGRVVKHYALTNHMELFAESTEAFFGVNDFYPFVRAELARHDPVTCALLVEIWGDDGARLRAAWKGGPHGPCRPVISTERFRSSVVGLAGFQDGQSIEGVRVRLAPGVLADAGLAARVVALIRLRLHDAHRRIPEAAWEILKTVPWHFEPGARGAPAWRSPREKTWPATIEIGSARVFDSRAEAQPGIALHLYAHAFYDLGLDGAARARIAAAFDRVREAGLYDRVLRMDGVEVRSPALLGPEELFATLSAAWLGVSDHYPFVRAELQDHDPASLALIAELWLTPRGK